MPKKTKVKISVIKTEIVDAEILDDITDENISDWENDWTPRMLELISRYPDHVGESAFWDWRRKRDSIKTANGKKYGMYSLTCDNATEGLMITSLDKHLEQELTYPTKELVYVEYLETAPWNQYFPGMDRKYKNVGGRLLVHAMVVSKALGFNGKVGLHSLKSSEQFYERMQLKCLSTDNNGLKYFESKE